MAFNQNIPQATDVISQSQADLLANFQALNGIASNTLPYLLLGPEQGSKPTVASQMALYTKTSTLSTIQAMFLEKADGTEIEFSTYGTSTSGLSKHGFTILPSGLILKWGKVQYTTFGMDITFPVAATIPVFTANPLMVQLTGQLSPSNTSLIVTSFRSASTLIIQQVNVGRLTVSGSTVAAAALDATNTYVNYLALGI